MFDPASEDEMSDSTTISDTIDCGRLAQEVFQIVAKRFADRARDIGWMTETQNSFEEWCGWEAWLACTENFEWDVYAKPQYSKFGLTGTEAGDWLVDDRRGNKLFVELGIIHDGTGPKVWSEKCDGDREKLLRIADKVPGLHLILVTSRLHEDILASEKWLSRWARLQCWGLDTSLSLSAPLPEGGQMLLKAWVVLPTDANS